MLTTLHTTSHVVLAHQAKKPFFAKFALSVVGAATAVPVLVSRRFVSLSPSKMAIKLALMLHSSFSYFNILLP